MTSIEIKAPLYDQFDGAGNPQTDEAGMALNAYFSALENAEGMTGGAGLNGWSGVSDPRQRPCQANSSSGATQVPNGEAWDTSGPGNFIE